MRVLVTGAGGFLGAEVVQALLRRGHTVRAVVRPASEHVPSPEVEVVRLDLRAPDGLGAALEGVDAVVHAAAVKTGDFHTQFAGTVQATENLVLAMSASSVRRLVLVSSFSVYDYERIPAGALVDEASPVVEPSRARDAYAVTKVMQEQVVREAAARHGWSAVVARPGAVYGADNLWTARLGFQSRDLWVCIGSSAPLPLTWVGNCADALALAAERRAEGVLTVNVVDDDPPSQARYRHELAARAGRPRRTVIVPWPAASAVVRGFDALRRAAGPLQLPSALRHDAAVARWRPVRFSNQRLVDELGWRQAVPFPTTLDLSVAQPG